MSARALTVKPTRISIGMKVGFLLLFPLLGSFAALGSFAYFLQLMRDDVRVVNVAGRQRMLASELHSWAQMVAGGQDEDRRGLGFRIEEFDAALGALRRGEVALGSTLPPAPAEVVPALAAVDDLWREMRPDLDSLAAAPRASPRFRKALNRGPETFTHLTDAADLVVRKFGARGERLLSRMLSVLGAAAAFMVVVFFGGIAFARRSLVLPIQRVSDASRRMSAGDFSVKIAGSGRDELSDLAESFNEMAARIEELLAARRLLSIAIEQSSESVMITDVGGSIQYVNPAFLRLTGYAADEVLGRNPSILKSGRHDKAYYDEMWAVLKRGESWSAHIVNRRKDGTLYDQAATISPVRDARGATAYYISVIRDDSKERAALLEKETLLKEIHHRVKNNMQIVASLLSLAAGSETDERVREPLLASKDRIASMALVHEALYGTASLSTLDMVEYLGRLLGDLTAAYAPPAVRVVTDLRPVVLDAKFAVHCGLIVTELFSNALKHAFPSGRKGEVRVGLKEEAAKITLIISDDGVGLPDDFDIANTTSLGLRLVRSIATQMRATIEIERGRGGASWRIAWPAAGKATVS